MQDNPHPPARFPAEGDSGAGRRVRYPGAGPFSESQRDIYFGREADIEALLRMLARHQQVVLYAKSGIGKSSLLQAGVIPRLRERGWTCLRVRFHPHSANAVTPLRRLEHISPDPEVPDWLRGIYPHSDSSPERDSIAPKASGPNGIVDGNELWLRYKAAQIKSGEQVLLVFDQFEELFTYPEQEIAAFKQVLAQLLYQTVPEEVRRRLRELEVQGQALTEDQFDQIFEPMRIKVVVALREDRISRIHDLVDALPDLRHNWFEIKPLSWMQARQAIVKPAALEGDYAVAPFRYTEAALHRILSHLTQDNTVAVETTQLQIICQKILSIRMASQSGGRDELGVEDLPDFNDVLRNFYLEVLQDVPEKNRRVTQVFVEDGLIHGGGRIPVAESICDERIGRIVLQFLVRRHLLRAEPNSTGSLSYELSHDILVAPILEVKLERELEEAMHAQREEEERLRNELDRVRRGKHRDRIRLRKTRIMLAIIGCLLIAAGILAYIAFSGEKKERSDKELAELARDELIKLNDRYKAAECARQKQLVRDFLRAEEYHLAQVAIDSALKYCVDNLETRQLQDDLNKKKQSNGKKSPAFNSR